MTTITIKDKSYDLRLTTRGTVQLEKALGYNPIQMFMDIEAGRLPKLGDLITVLHYMLLDQNHSIKIDDTYDIFNGYLAEGHEMFDIVPIFIEVMKECGLIHESTEEPEEGKN